LFASGGGTAVFAQSGADPNALEGSLPASLRDDATLHAVAFADVDRGWAVGDRGVIWHTDNGGDSWHPQPSGTPYPLFDVSFADARRGFAVGGWYEPQTQLSHAVVLVTTNAGRTWEKLATDLPLLRQVTLNRQGSVIVAGDFSSLHLSSLFESDDAGRNWTPLLSDELRRVEGFSGDTSGPLTVLGRGGIVFRYRDLATQPLASIASQQLQTVAGSEQLRLAIGTQGTAFLSRDGGQRWSRLPLPRPLADREWLGADEVSGTFWSIGRPGNLVLKIDSQGQITSFATPANSTMRDIDFLDPQRGWAVGAFGSIIATRDGGKTWRFQRAPQRRAALLAVAAETGGLSWPALASESLEMGRRFAVCLHQAPEQDESADTDPLLPAIGDLTAQATSALGGGEVAWIKAAPEGSIAAIENLLQTYQPQVLVLDAQLDRALRQRWIGAAMEADVARVFETCDDASSDLTVHGAAILPRAGAMTDDLWRDARALLQPGTACPEKIYLRCTYDAVSRSKRSLNGLFANLPVGDPADSRPLREQASRRLLQVLRARAEQRSLVDKMVAEGNLRGAFSSRLDLLISQTPDNARARLIQDVLHRCREHNRPELYRETLTAASHALTNQPVGRMARLRLNAIEPSVEWRALQRSKIAKPTIAAASASSGSVKLSPFAERNEPIDPDELVQTAATFDGGDSAMEQSTAVERPSSSSDQAIDLIWDFDPRVLLVREATRRHDLAISGEASEKPSADIRRWRDAIPMHGWAVLAGVAPEAEKRIARVAQPPRLDGRLDEAFWNAAEVVATSGEAQLRVAFDAQYVYWAFEGPAPEIEPAAPDTEAPRRDAFLTDRTRAALRIDVDGDLLTSFVLEVSPAGLTRDTCDGFTAWHPMWFVDSQIVDGRWVVEAAVRRKDIQSLPLSADDRWRFRFDILKPGEVADFEALPSADQWTVGRFQ
ncbi:MAG: YCF48-related protein, partial [Pirellulaceae bacterium]